MADSPFSFGSGRQSARTSSLFGSPTDSVFGSMPQSVRTDPVFGSVPHSLSGFVPQSVRTDSPFGSVPQSILTHSLSGSGPQSVPTDSPFGSGLQSARTDSLFGSGPQSVPTKAHSRPVAGGISEVSVEPTVNPGIATTKPQSMADSKVMSLKLLIDKKEKRVLFAEAGKDFVDFLFSILSLPLGTITSLLAKQPSMIGSLRNLYNSIENLSKQYIQPNRHKSTILKPKLPVSALPFPLLSLDSPPAAANRKFYGCSNCGNSTYVAGNASTVCPNCRCKMSRELIYVDPPATAAKGVGEEEGGLVKGVVTYMVMDDLGVTPMSTISSITLVNRFNIVDLRVLQEKVVPLGIDEALKLLNASLESKTVLTSVFLEA
ncbi:hypothetical protein LguiA_035006 [Lonicera macranthoides]